MSADPSLNYVDAMPSYNSRSLEPESSPAVTDQAAHEQQVEEIEDDEPQSYSSKRRKLRSSYSLRKQQLTTIEERRVG